MSSTTICVHLLQLLTFRFWKGRTQLPLTLASAIWFRNRVGDIPAASSLVKSIPGTSAILRRSCWAKSKRKIPVSTPSKNKVCDFESLICGPDKILSTKVSALEIFFNLLLKFSFFLLCNWLRNQIFVVHRSRNEDKLLRIKIFGYWREEL